VVPEEAVLIVAGLHVPFIAGVFDELVGNAGAVEFWHNGPICINVGLIDGIITISIVVTTAHCPVPGV
jgi:hypothetical protein